MATAMADMAAEVEAREGVQWSVASRTDSRKPAICRVRCLGWNRRWATTWGLF